jgi:hypothetical protein
MAEGSVVQPERVVSWWHETNSAAISTVVRAGRHRCTVSSHESRPLVVSEGSADDSAGRLNPSGAERFGLSIAWYSMIEHGDDDDEGTSQPRDNNRHTGPRRCLSIE